MKLAIEVTPPSMNTSFNQDPLTNVDSSTETVHRLEQHIQLLERCLEVRDARNRQLMAAMPQITWMAQADGSIIDFNDRWSEYTGLSVAESLYWGFLNAVHPDDRDRVVTSWQQAARNNIYELECRLLGKKGTYKSFKSQAAAIVNSQGAIEEWVGTYTEIRDAQCSSNNLEQDPEFVKALLANLSDGIVACDADGVLRLFNRASEEFHGLPQEAIRPEQWANYYDLYRLDGTPMPIEEIPLFRALNGESVHNAELVITPKNGMTRTVLSNGNAIFNSAGKKIGAVVAMRDITDRVLAELALRDSQERLEQILDTIPDGIVIVNREGQLTSANPAAEKILGLSKRKISQRVYNEPAWAIETVDGKPFPEEELPFVWVMRSEKPVYGIEQAIKREDDTRVVVSVNAAPLRNAAGEIEGMVAVISDITARKQLEAERDALRAISQRFFTLSIDMLCIAGLDGYFTQLNPAFEKTLGYSNEELLSQPFINFVHPEDRSVTLAELENLSSGASTLYFQNRYLCKNGEYKWLSWTAVPILAENLVYAIARDITPTKQMEETLHRREQEYKALLEAIPDVIARCDRELRYLYVNPEVERTTGVPAAEFVGKTFAEMGAPPELCQLWEDTLTKVFASGTEQEIEFESYNLEGFRKFQSRVVPEFNQDGIVQYGLVVSRDLTELKQAEAEIRTLNAELEKRVIERTAQLEAANQEKDQLLVREQAARAQAEAMEQRFRELVNGLVDAIVWECDAVTVQFSFISQSAERILGYPAQRWLTESGFWGSLIHPDDREWVVNFCREETSHGRDHEFEYRCIAADGRIVWLRDRAYVVRDESGKIEKLRGLMIDITERKQAEEEREKALIALQQSEAKFRRVAESNMIGILFWNMDGNITDANDAFLEMVGYTQEDLQAGLLHSPKMTPPEFQHQDEAALEALKRHGVCNPWEKDYIRKDGSRVPVLLGGALLEDSQHDGVAFVVELTERKQVEAALKESEERFRTMANTAPVLIWVSGVNGFCNWFNKPWLDFTGRSMEQEIGQGWTKGVHPEDLTRCSNTYLSAFNARKEFRLEYRLQRADGQYRWLLNNGVPRFLPSGEFAGYIGGCIDITDRIAAEEALRVRADQLAEMAAILAQTNGVLEKRNQELDQFAYVASHDLKAPLRAIANLAHWIEEDIEGQLNDETRQHLNLLKGRVHRMEGLINALLQYSRAGRIKTEPQRVNVQELLEEVIDSLAAPPEFQIKIDPGMPTLFAERLPLEQIFSNLIANAIKHHHRPDGTVEISVRERSDVYEFAVTDDGPGIAPQYHDKIFLIFQTLQPRDKVENTGVGLSLVKRILDSQGGNIKVKSAEGEGATFYFTLPKSSKV